MRRLHLYSQNEIYVMSRVYLSLCRYCVETTMRGGVHAKHLQSICESQVDRTVEGETCSHSAQPDCFNHLTNCWVVRRTKISPYQAFLRFSNFYFQYISPITMPVCIAKALSISPLQFGRHAMICFRIMQFENYVVARLYPDSRLKQE